MTIDLISDMITRLRNAAIINKKLISLPFNKNNYIIIKILEREGYIFCSTFINNKDKLFLKLLELIFIKKNLSYNDTRVKNLLFFIRDFVKVHQHPENIKKFSRSEKKTLSFLNSIDNNLIKEENVSDMKDLADPMSLLISKFRNSYIEHKKVKSSSSARRPSLLKSRFNSLPQNEAEPSTTSLLKNQELQASTSQIDTISLLKKKDLRLRLLIGSNVLDNMDVNFYINHLSSSTLELKKKINDIYSNLHTIKVNSKSDDANSNLARFSSTASQITKTLDDMYSNLTFPSLLGYSSVQDGQYNNGKSVEKTGPGKTKLNRSSSESLPRETGIENSRSSTVSLENKSRLPAVSLENTISILANFQKNLDETHSLIPMPVSMRKISYRSGSSLRSLSEQRERKRNGELRGININDLEFSLTKLKKHKDDINSYLFKLSKNTDDLQLYIKRSCQQVAKLNLNLRTNQYPNEFSVIASTQQKNLEDLQYIFKYELNKNLDDIIFYFNRLTKILDTIISTFNVTELKKYFGIKSMQTSTELKKNPFAEYYTSNNIAITSYMTNLPSIKLELKKNLDFVTSKFTELNKNFNHIQSNPNSKHNKILGSQQTDFPSLKIEEEKRLKEIFYNINSTLTHLPSDTLDFSNNLQIDDINSYISHLSVAMLELNDITSNLNTQASTHFSSFSKEFADEEQLKNPKKNSMPNFTFEGTKADYNSIDKPLKINEKSKNLKKRLKPDEKIPYYYDSIQGKNTSLPFSFNSEGAKAFSASSSLNQENDKERAEQKNGDSINSISSPSFLSNIPPSRRSDQTEKRQDNTEKIEKNEHKKPLNLQKYLRKKNNKTFQTLFNPNFSKIILLALNLNAKEKSSIHGIRRISKPSLRCYSSNPIPRSFGGLGVFIVSTNCGIMTDNEAREKKLGGEIMLEIW